MLGVDHRLALSSPALVSALLKIVLQTEFANLGMRAVISTWEWHNIFFGLAEGARGTFLKPVLPFRDLLPPNYA
jgi:hypothetical protein